MAKNQLHARCLNQSARRCMCVDLQYDLTGQPSTDFIMSQVHLGIYIRVKMFVILYIYMYIPGQQTNVVQC